jgi:hypothetical protein
MQLLAEEQVEDTSDAFSRQELVIEEHTRSLRRTISSIPPRVPSVLLMDGAMWMHTSACVCVCMCVCVSTALQQRCNNARRSRDRATAFRRPLFGGAEWLAILTEKCTWICKAFEWFLPLLVLISRGVFSRYENYNGSNRTLILRYGLVNVSICT